MSEPNKGGAGSCVVCNHPAVLTVNAFITEKKVELDGQVFTASTQLGAYLTKKFPNFQTINPWNITRHKNHVAGFEQGTAMILRGNKLFRPTPDGNLEEIRQFEPEVALRIIISIGLDAIVGGRMKLGAKSLIDAIKIYADLMENKEDPDAYDRIVAERHKGTVIEMPAKGPVNADSILDSVPKVQIPTDLAPPSQDEDEEEDDEGE